MYFYFLFFVFLIIIRYFYFLFPSFLVLSGIFTFFFSSFYYHHVFLLSFSVFLLIIRYFYFLFPSFLVLSGFFTFFFSSFLKFFFSSSISLYKERIISTLCIRPSVCHAVCVNTALSIAPRVHPLLKSWRAVEVESATFEPLTRGFKLNNVSKFGSWNAYTIVR